MPDPHIEIRSAKPGDCAALVDLYRDLNPADQPIPNDRERLEIWRAMLEQPGFSCIVGIAEGTLVESCSLAIIPNLTRGAVPTRSSRTSSRTATIDAAVLGERFSAMLCATPGRPDATRSCCSAVRNGPKCTVSTSPADSDLMTRLALWRGQFNNVLNLLPNIQMEPTRQTCRAGLWRAAHLAR